MHRKRLAAALFAVSALCLLFALLWGRGRWWWLRAVPVSVFAAVVVGVAGYFTVNYLWHPYPDLIPWMLFAWAGFAVLCGYAAVLTGLAAWRLRRSDA